MYNTLKNIKQILQNTDDDDLELDFINAKNQYGDIKRIRSDGDILARSHAWYRLRQDGNGGGHINTLTSNVLTVNLKFEDYAAANKIRDYYSKKLVLWQLKGKTLSPFRKCLADFLTTDVSEYQNEYSGIIFRLPEFYYYDTILDTHKEETFVNTPKPSENPHAYESKKLKPVVKLTRKSRSNDSMVFWYEVEGTGCAAKIHIDIKNPLLKLWENLFDSNQVVTIFGHYFINHTGNFDHYSVEKWRILDNLTVES